MSSLPGSARFLRGWVALCLGGALLLGISMRGLDFGVWFTGSAVGSLATGGLLALSLKLRRRYSRRLLRIVLSLGASWTIMMLVIITISCVTPDPFAAERIARSGYVMYFLEDKLLRALFFGGLVGTFMFSWAWLPMAALWHALMKWIERGGETGR